MSHSRRTFRGKVAIITGGARGIGAEVARGYVARGGRVALVGLEPDLLEALVGELGDAAAWWEADVRDGAALKSAIDAAVLHFGRVDHVLANAGIASYGTVRDVDEATFDRVIDSNVGGVFRTIKYSAEHLVESRGYLMVVSSLAAFTPLAGLAAYNSSKAGCEALALAARQELAHLGVGVGVCHPSWVDTEIVRGAEADIPTFEKIRGMLPYPANSTTSVETCAKAILRGLRRRKGRIYVPRGVMLANWSQALVSSPLAALMMRRLLEQHVPKMEAEVRALGRFTHAHLPADPANAEVVDG